MMLDHLAATVVVLLSLIGPAAAECVPPEFPSNYLQRQEQEGGHTIARHVGKSDIWLMERLGRDQRLRFASSYSDLATAEDAVERVLSRHRTEINRWERTHGRNSETTVRDTLPQPVGHTAYRPIESAHVAERRTIVVIVKKIDDGSCVLLTSYPGF
jgi:hypothetical protein